MIAIANCEMWIMYEKYTKCKLIDAMVIYTQSTRIHAKWGNFPLECALVDRKNLLLMLLGIDFHVGKCQYQYDNVLSLKTFLSVFT